MRLLLDTNTFIYWTTDRDYLNRDVKALLQDYSNVPCLSVESMKELIVLFHNRGIVSKRWESAKAMIDAIGTEIQIDVLPVDANVMRTYSRLELNTAQDHRDPSDHVIIAHAITLGLPLISSDRKFAFYQSQGLDLIQNLK